MPSRPGLITLCFAVVALAVLPAARAEACKCAPQSAKETYESMDAAFTGRLLEIRESSDERFLVYRYRVGRDYKHNLRDTVRVRVLALSDCGLTGNTAGRRYSLFLYRSADGLRRTRTGPWTSNLCLETSKAALEKASRDVKSSGTGGGSTGCTGS